jgi:ribosome-binding protein aMBF1 (putative translation factor)
VHGISQERLAALLEVNETTLRLWELTLHHPFPKTLQRLEKILIPKA